MVAFHSWASVQRFLVLIVAACIACCLSDQSEAAYVMITSRADLAANGQFNLANLGPEGTSVGIQFDLTANSGTTAHFSQAAGQGERVNESGLWNGNFAPNAPLIWSRYGGPVQVDFGTTKIKTFGTQIQPDMFGAFTAYIKALDSNGTELAKFEFNGTSTDKHDNSALFIGIGSDSPSTNFSRIEIGLSSGGNLLNFAYDSPSFAVPEPATWVLSGVAMSAVVLAHRRKKAAKA